MSSLVKFTPLWGARNEQPMCYLLEIDEACILLDCGWDESFDTRILPPIRDLKKLAARIDAVLLTHCDLMHLGALPYLVKECNLRAKVFATLPVQKMGQLTMYDIVQSRTAKEEFDVLSLADIDAAWDLFVQLRYQQTTSLTGKADGITISPLNAGHLIGGAVWKITKDSEEIVYAVDYNHAQDRHLDGTVLVDLPRPSILITDAYTALDKPFPGGKKAREAALLEKVQSGIDNGGNVLLPVDSTGRVLELMILLDEYWSVRNLRGVTLAFLSPESRSTVDMAMSQTEWLSKHVNHKFVQSRQNVFHFNHLKRCCTMQELRALPMPQVVLASGLDLETSSFALDLFAEWASDPRNAVILTQKARPDSFARRLHDDLLEHRKLPNRMELQMHKRVALEGRELREYEEKQKQAEEDAKRKLEEEEAEEEEEEGGGGGGKTEGAEGGEGGEEAVKPKPTTPKAADGGGGWKQRKRPRATESRYLMYPHVEEMLMFDEYGEQMDTSIYLKEDQQEEVKGFVEETITFSGGTTDDPRLVNSVEPDKKPVDIPTKSVGYIVRIALECSLSFLDWGGRSDGRSTHMILEHLKPAKVIIVHGSEAATQELRSFCVKKVTEPDNTFAPKVGEAVQASSDTNIYRIKLDSELAKGLAFMRVGGYDVAYVDGVVEMQDQPSAPAPPSGPAAEAKGGEMPTLVQRNTGEGGGGKPFAFIGDVKLSDLKLLLSNQGFRTELKAGMLVVNGLIIIRKSGSRMVFEGSICKEYAAVRKLLLSQYHTL